MSNGATATCYGYEREACVTRTRVHLEGALEVKGSNVEDPVDGDVGARAPLDGRVGVHRLEARLDADKVRLLHEIRLVEQNCAKKEREARAEVSVCRVSGVTSESRAAEGG